MPSTHLGLLVEDEHTPLSFDARLMLVPSEFLCEAVLLFNVTPPGFSLSQVCHWCYSSRAAARVSTCVVEGLSWERVPEACPDR